jgi:hypothetical protein
MPERKLRSRNAPRHQAGSHGNRPVSHKIFHPINNPINIYKPFPKINRQKEHGVFLSLFI